MNILKHLGLFQANQGGFANYETLPFYRGGVTGIVLMIPCAKWNQPPIGQH
jgi:hypothetical protein